MLQDNVPTWPIEQVVAELTHAARSQSPDDEVLVDALPHGEQVIALQSQLVSPPQPMQNAFQSRPAGTASPRGIRLFASGYDGRSRRPYGSC